MAYTSVIPVHRLDNTVDYVLNPEKTRLPPSLKDVVGYALNRDKTESGCFESSIGCTCENAYEDMVACKKKWQSIAGIQGYHLIQSFAEGEITPELAHKIGVEFAEQLLGGQYQVVITTHLNTSHYHNHIVWNSVNIMTGKKYHCNAKTYATEIRAISDKLCRQYGLSVIATERAAQVSKPYAEWQAEKAGQPTWRTVIRQDIDAAVARSLTWRQFLHLLEGQGYVLNMDRKYPTLRPPGKDRPVRFKTLGKSYTPDAIRLRILYPGARQNPAGVGQPPRIQYGRLRGSHTRPRRKLTGLQALYYRYLYELGALRKKPQRPGYSVREDIRHLDQRIEQMRFLMENGINTLDQLEQKRAGTAEQIRQLTNRRRREYQHTPSNPEIDQLTTRLQTLRREEKLCGQIAAASLEMQQRLQADREETHHQQQQQQQRRQPRHQHHQFTKL